MLSIEQAQTLLANTPSLNLPAVQMLLCDVLNFRVNQVIVAPLDVPPAANSAMDGYALNLEDLKKNNYTLPVSQRIPAGASPCPLQKNTCARIFTGAMIPEGANTVIIQENTTINLDQVVFNGGERYSANDNIRPQGQDINAGQLLANSGQKITPALMGLLASQGLEKIWVQAPIKVALLSTGDEVVTPGQPLTTGQIYNSNRYSVGSLLKHWGQVTLTYIDVPDTFDATCQAIKRAAQSHDLVISFGGVSVGEEDHVRNAVASLGQVEHWKVKLKPGKPIMSGTITTGTNTPILGLPGNPVSAFVTFLLFGKPLLAALTGAQFTPSTPISVRISFDIKKTKKRPEYIRVRIIDGKLQLCSNQSSGVLSSLHECDGLAFIPEDTLLNKNDRVDYYPLETLVNR